MQSWNATFFLFFFFFIRCGAGGGWGGDFGSDSGSKFNFAARVGSGQTISGTGRGGGVISGRIRALNLTLPLGSGRVRRSRVRAGFGLQFWARADL